MTRFLTIFSLSLLSLPAVAQDAGAKGGFDFVQFVPLIAIFGIFYFLLIRPQQKKMKQHREMLTTLRRGDRVVTAGGIIGSVHKVESDEELHVDIGNGHVVRVVRSTVSQVLDKTAPVSSIDSAKPKAATATKKKASATKAPKRKAKSK